MCVYVCVWEREREMSLFAKRICRLVGSGVMIVAQMARESLVLEQMDEGGNSKEGARHC